MKAIVYDQYGSPEVLQLKEVEKPAPKDDEVLVKIRAVSLNRSDWEGLIGDPFYARMPGLLKPSNSILGSDVAGTIEAVGPTHAIFKPGDDIFGETENYHGGFAEYVCTRANTWALKPAGLTFEQASAIPQAGVIALQGLRRVQPGQSVLINGAGGGTGLFAIQLAKSYGAEVTGVDNAGKQDFMRALGADHVIDYTRDDFTRDGKQHDLILDLIAHRSPFDCARALRRNGKYLAVGGSVSTFLRMFLFSAWIKWTASKTVFVLPVQRNRKDLEAITQLCESGKIALHIDKQYRLNEVSEALRSLGEGRAKGKVVILL